MITFTAYGVPAPKGSMKAFMPKGARFPIVTEDNKHTRPWASLVKAAALDAIGSREIPYPDSPLRVSIVFYMPRPQSLPRRVQWHTKKPDLDKLQRTILDSLKGVIWTDDSQVVDIQASKNYTARDMPRAEIQVSSVQEGAVAARSYGEEGKIEQLGLRACGLGC